MAFLGGLFDSPRLESRSTINPLQQAMLARLSEFLGGELGNNDFQVRVNEILSGDSDFVNQLSTNLFSNAIFGPAMREFNRTTKPAIAGAFANIGGSLSSRRGKAISDAATRVQEQSVASLTGILPSLIDTQLRGLGMAQEARYRPVQAALQLALSPTQQTAERPGGMGWGLLSSLIEGGTTLGAASILA